MRIAFVYDAIYPWVAGGAERRFHELGQRLRGRHEVSFVGWQWWDGPARIQRDGVTLHGVGRPPGLYGTDGKRTVREAVAFSTRLLPVLLRNRWDVIDCSATPYLPLYTTALAARLRRTRLVATWHEFWGEHWNEYLPHRPGVARAARWLESGGRRLGDRVVTVSDFTARAMGMADDPRLEVVPNGVAVAEILDAAPAEDARDLLFIGRLIDEKRVDLLLEAVQLLVPRFPALRCAVVGDGPELPALREQAARLGIDRHVRFHGRVPASDVPRHLRAARILAMPSVREGYGLAVAEAQAAGVVPVVVRSPFSAASDLVRDGVDGVLVEPTSTALAGAIGDLLADETRLRELSAAAALTGTERDWERVAARMEHVYRGEVADDRATRPVRRLRWS
jgi:glycosyltransferase involved in cell wall biosynthesis